MGPGGDRVLDVGGRLRARFAARQAAGQLRRRHPHLHHACRDLGQPAVEAHEGRAALGSPEVEGVGEVEALFGPVQRRGGEPRVLQRDPRQAGEVAKLPDEAPGREAVAASAPD
jgi:hypothetical protein